MIEEKEYESKTDIVDTLPDVQEVERCPYGGDECKFLQKLLSKCRTLKDIEVWGNTTRTKEDDDAIAHCLYFHEEYREECQIQNCTFRKSQHIKINRYAQFHRQFFHNLAIDDAEGREENKMMKERIEYKPMNINTNVLQFGCPFMINNKQDAKFKNPKEEMLKNEYHRLKAAEWNEIIRKCIFFSKSKNGKKSHLNTKLIVALKLYTDHDELQREF